MLYPTFFSAWVNMHCSSEESLQNLQKLVKDTKLPFPILNKKKERKKNPKPSNIK